MGVIYKATNLINGKSYIGQTKRDLETRKKEHLKRKGYTFHSALEKYGIENFEWSILEECEDDKLNEREIFWIDYYDTYNNGYNETSGGDNAESLDNWRKNHPEEFKNCCLKNLEKAQAYHKVHREKNLQQLASVRQKGIDKTKRKVLCIELNKLFDSLADAERWSLTKDNPNGKRVTHQGIGRVCRGLRKTCGGYTWKYVDN